MEYTQKYCSDCSKKLSPADKSIEDRDFFEASLFHEGNIPPHPGLHMDIEGTCHKCGKVGHVEYYTKLAQ